MKLGLILASLAGLNMLCWFLFQGWVLATGDAGVQTDAFFASATLPQLVASIVNSSLMHVLVPFFAGEDPATVRRDAYSLVVLVLIVCGAVCAILYITASWWVPVTVIGFTDAGKALTVELARIQLIGMLFALMGAVLFAACHGQQQFLRAELSPMIATSVAFAAVIFVFPRYGVVGAAWIVVARSAMMILFLLPVLGKPVAPQFARVRMVWRKVKPLLLSASYYKGDQLVDRFFSSMGSAGQLSVFYFAYQVFLAGALVIGKAVAAPIVPRLAMYAKAAEWEAFHALCRKRLEIIICIAVLAWICTLGATQPFLELVGQFKDMNDIQEELLLQLMGLLPGVLIGGLAGLVLAESFFAMGDSRTPAIALAAFFTLGIGFKAAGFALAGVEGLAAGTTLYFFSYPVGLYVLLERRLKSLCTCAELAPSVPGL